jgi:hypothetical protein
MALYLIANGITPTSSAAVIAVTTGTALKTMLQVKASATKPLQIVEWGISLNGSAAAAPGIVELIEVNSAATVTASVAGDITKLDAEALAGGDPTTNLIPVGTTSTGFTASSEGSPTATRIFDVQYVAPTNQYVKQFPLGLEPVVQVSQFARIRVTFASGAVNAYCYMVVRV